MSLLDELRKKFGKLYNIDELLILTYNSKLKCFRCEYDCNHPVFEDYSKLSSPIDRTTALKFIAYAQQLLEKDNYTTLEMNEVFIAWLDVNEFEVLG